MNKIKYYLLGSIIVSLAIFGGIVFLAKSTEAEAETSTTFPVDEAGIAAYVKVDNINDIDKNALAEAFETIEKSGESYVIGKVKVDNYVGAYDIRADYPHVYIGMDGWIVAYYLKEEHASRIIHWKGGPGLKSGSDLIDTTTLQEAIDNICKKTRLTYSTPIKYYDFEFPEANKMTIIGEQLIRSYPSRNSFYVTVPGTLYEASYTISIDFSAGTWTVSLKVDDISIFEETRTVVASEDGVFFGYLDPLTYFKTGVTHYVTCDGGEGYGGCGIVLIYKN